MDIYEHVLESLRELATEVEAWRRGRFIPDPEDRQSIYDLLQALQECHEDIVRLGPQL